VSQVIDEEEKSTNEPKLTLSPLVVSASSDLRSPSAGPLACISWFLTASSLSRRRTRRSRLTSRKTDGILKE